MYLRRISARKPSDMYANSYKLLNCVQYFVRERHVSLKIYFLKKQVSALHV
jgi:hypothetical protein